MLPIRIHELDAPDKKTIETQIGPLRSIDFTYQSSGVNRPLRPKDDESIKGAQSVYRDQINKTANAMEEVFKCADILSLHCPLNESTHHIINKEAIDMMKKGVMIINSSRGGLIDTKAAIYGLKI